MIHCPACRPPGGAVKCTPHMRTAATESIGPIIHASGTRNVLHTTAAVTLIANAPAGGQSACSRTFICPDEKDGPKIAPFAKLSKRDRASEALSQSSLPFPALWDANQTLSATVTRPGLRFTACGCPTNTRA